MHGNGVGQFDTPEISGQVETYEPCVFLGYNEKAPASGDYGCHFFLDDYQFQRVWNNPLVHLPKLTMYKYVLAPDFSLFVDWPRALSVYNHYRKHWCARFWQENGITVIPVVRWMYRDSWEWCFDGEPVNAIIAVSSKGINNDTKMNGMFRDGYEEMERRLKPRQVLWFGKYCLEEERGNVTFCKTGFDERIKLLRRDHARIPKYRQESDADGRR